MDFAGNLSSFPSGLTDDEKKVFREWIAHAPRCDADKFINELNRVLLITKRFLGGVTIRTSKITQQKKRVLKSLDKTIGEVEELYRASCISDDYRKETTPPGLSPLPIKIRYRRPDRDRWEPLYVIRDQLQMELSQRAKEPGRMLDSSAGVKRILVISIAMLYYKYTSANPSFYYQDGNLYNILKLAFKLLKLPSKAPDKIIRSALNIPNIHEKIKSQDPFFLIEASNFGEGKDDSWFASAILYDGGRGEYLHVQFLGNPPPLTPR